MSSHRASSHRAADPSPRPRRRRRPVAWTTTVSAVVATAVVTAVALHPGEPSAPQAPDARTAQAGSGVPALSAEQLDLASAQTSVRRVTGDDRVATSVAVSRDRFPAGMPAAVLASADDFADALAGSALADAVGGPLLLSHRDGLDERVAAELRDHLDEGGVVYVLGGTRALASGVDAAVVAAGGAPVRLAGDDRYATAAVVARQVRTAGPGEECDAVLVTGKDFPDGAAAAGVVGAHRPLLFTAGSQMPLATRAALAACTEPGSTVTAVGGPAASAAEAGGLPQDLEVEDVVGADRFETSAKLMQLAVTGGERTAAAAVATTEPSEEPEPSSDEPTDESSQQPSEQPTADQDGERVTAQTGPAPAPDGASASASSSPSASASDPGQEDAQLAASVRAEAAGGPVVIANGASFADALVGGTYHRPVLLTEATALPGSVADALHAASSDVQGVLVVGGERAVSPGAADAAAQIASGAEPAGVLAAMRAASPSASASASPSASPSVSTASPSASSSQRPSSGASSAAPSSSPAGSAGPGGTGGSAIAAPPAGTWFSGASGTGVADGSFATWRGSELGIVGTWSDNNTAMVEAWALQPGQEFGSWRGNVDIAVGAIGGGESWQAASTGAYDARWRTSLAKMKTLWGDKPGTVYIRFAHEMNGNWYDWSVNKGNKDAFVASWKRYRALQQEIFPKSKLVFSVNRESVSSGFNWTESFPGKQYVDVMGVDYYNQYPTANSVEDFRGALGAKDGYGAPKGLQAHSDFARSVGLPLSVNEWSGISDNADSPGFIQGMHEFFAKNAGSGPGQILYDVQFNCDMGGGKFMLYQGKMPKSADMYRKLF